ncbi:hypothetical protein [Streptomyces mirabilis]|uniref:hypothetical protein n=1 Tax=Streptomyces mirabilis TaxID=68239 RepID=UPI0036CF0158
MPQSSQDNRTEYIAGLRQLADWLEQHPDADVPYVADIAVPLFSNEAVEAFAAGNGLEVRIDSDGNASATVPFGRLVYRVYGYANWDAWKIHHDEKTARNWADKNDMVIQPREGGDES